MSQIPEIKADVNRETEERKKPGFFWRLLGGGGSAEGGLGGVFGAGGGGLGGVAAGGGLLATKAGLLALIVAGTAAAGGIGLLGYKLFGPGSDQAGGNLQLFAARPKEAPAADSQAAPKDGSSESLKMLAQGSAGADKASADAASASAAKDPSASGEAKTAEDASGGPANASASSGSGVNKGLLKSGGRFGTLSQGGGGGGGGAAVSAGAGGSLGKSLDYAAKAGSLSGFSKGARAGVSSSARSVAGRQGGKAFKQLGSVLRDQKGAGSSYGAGRTYYGGAASGSGDITGDGASSVGGSGDIGTGTQSKTTPNNSVPQTKTTEPSTPPDTKDVTPWQDDIEKVQMLIGAAIVLGLLAWALSKVKWFSAGTLETIIRCIGGLITAIGVAIIALGVQLATGQYGQTTQGYILAAAGVGVCIMGASIMTDPSGLGSAKDLAGLPTLLQIGGAMAGLGLAATMMKTPKPISQDECKSRGISNCEAYNAPASPDARYLADVGSASTERECA